MITYRTATSRKGIERYLALVKKHKLWVPGWTFEQDVPYWAERDSTPVKGVSMAFDGETPIGWCVYYNYSAMNPNVYSFFVRERHRRKKIGTNLYHKLKRRHPNSPVNFLPGIIGSPCFFETLRTGTTK